MVGLGFAFGLLGAALVAIKNVTWKHVLYTVTGFILTSFITVAEVSSDRVLTPNDIPKVLLVAAIVVTLFLVLMCAKRMRIGIDELMYTGYLGIVWFIFFEHFTSNSVLTLVFAVVTVVMMMPLWRTEPLRHGLQFIYYVGYSMLVGGLFLVYVGFDGVLSSLDSVTDPWIGAVSGLLIGWAFFNTFVHLVFLWLLIPNKRWGESLKLVYQVSIVQFKDTQYHAELLTLVFVIGFLLPWGLMFFVDSTVLSISLTIACVTVLGQQRAKFLRRSYRFTPQQVLDKQFE